MNSEIARVHRAGVIIELEQIGKKISDKYSLDWFTSVWDQQANGIIAFVMHGKIRGFGTYVGGEIMVYVDPDFHRKGIGGFLIKNLKGETWVLEGNKIAEGFYTKNGYAKTGESRNRMRFDHEIMENLWERGDGRT